MSDLRRRLFPNGLLLLILAGAAFLRFYRLDASSLWSDEGNTWALLGRSYADIAASAAADIHPPGYYWLAKLWTGPVGRDAWGMRSLSAVAGVLVVYVVYRIGLHLARSAAQRHTVALVAALVAAVNPFLVYYSQEARMYMLLTLQSAGLFWALLALTRAEEGKDVMDAAGRPRRVRIGLALAAYFLCAVAGVWTHYSFPIVWAAAAAAWLWWWLPARRGVQGRAGWAALGRFAAANLLALAIFAPWLPTAVRGVLNWPTRGEEVSFLDAVVLTFQMMTLGPTRTIPGQLWLWVAAAVVLPLAGLAALRRTPQTAGALALWMGAPLGLMFGLGLFSDAFLKFLLSAAPAWCLLVSAAVLLVQRTEAVAWLMAGAALLVASVTLPGYYFEPAVRDNYAGVAAYVSAVADPAAALVVLNAPGQQEVWDYYAAPLPVLAVPAERPPDVAATVAALEEATAGKSEVYALFWATDESDPGRVVETWLDRQAFKGLESWQGNLRFVTYGLPTALTCRRLEPRADFGGLIALNHHCSPAGANELAPGEVARVGLQWQSFQSLDRRYKVTVQLLDDRGQVIAQHDGEPAGGTEPTDRWQPMQPVTDNHALVAPLGTPPGRYQMIVAVYDPATGQRLGVNRSDHYVLGEVEVLPSARPIPADVLPAQHRVGAELGPLKLVGYSVQRSGFAHAPETPVEPGHVVNYTFFWQAPDPLPPDWPADLEFTLRLGDQSVQSSLAGGAYPTGEWQPGTVVRASFDIPYNGGDRRARLTVGDDTLRLAALPR